jgi:NADH:ubiquinone oxidoreductase subunit 6 (subunit J)
MKKNIKFIVSLGGFALIALLVYIAGHFALSGSPILALVPVALVLGAIVFYIKWNERED